MAGRHAQTGRSGGSLRLVAVISAFVVLAVAVAGAGAFLGLARPFAESAAVASTVSPSPTPRTVTAEPVSPVQEVEPDLPPVWASHELGAEPVRLNTPDIDVLDWDGDPAYVTDVYPDEAKALYGVGIIIRIQFGYDVPDEQKALLEQAAVVESSKPLGLAAWSWPDDRTMAFRPAEFWPAYMDVKVKFSWVEHNLATIDPVVKFRIGRSQIFEMNSTKLIGKVKRDGITIRRVPVSLGKSGWETTSGIKAILERYEVKRMVNPGPLEPYDVMVPYALRTTPSGEYLHAAPWNLYNLGYASTSHGCTNMSTEDAIWFFKWAFEGDPVIQETTGPEVDWTEGPGAMWNFDWADWSARSFALP